MYKADSDYTSNKAQKCKSKTDYTEWQRHGFENPHFFDIMYLPTCDMYARLHVDAIDFGKNGVVTFEAKTDELAKHYIRDFGAIRVFAKQSGGPIMLMLADNAALSLFNTYLS